jgi:hypothetical protein
MVDTIVRVADTIVVLEGAELLADLIGRSESAAGEAEASADLSKQSADRAEQSADLAQAASLTIDGVAATIAAGLAATPDGGTFWAQSETGIPIFYRRVGTNAVPIGSIFSSGGLPLSSFGARPDAKAIPEGASTADSKTFVSVDNRFNPGDVGKLIIVAVAMVIVVAD